MNSKYPSIVIDFNDKTRPDLYTVDQMFAVSGKDQKIYPNNINLKYHQKNETKTKIRIKYDEIPKIDSFTVGNPEPEIDTKPFKKTSEARDFIIERFDQIGNSIPFYFFAKKIDCIPDQIKSLFKTQIGYAKGAMMQWVKLPNMNQHEKNTFVPVAISPQEDEFAEILTHDDPRIQNHTISYGYAQLPTISNNKDCIDMNNIILVKAKVFINQYIPFLYAFHKKRLQNSLKVSDLFQDITNLLFPKKEIEVALIWKDENKTKRIQLSIFDKKNSIMSYLSLFDSNPINKMKQKLSLDVKIRY